MYSQWLFNTRSGQLYHAGTPKEKDEVMLRDSAWETISDEEYKAFKLAIRYAFCEAVASTVDL